MNAATANAASLPVLPNFIASNLKLLRKAQGWSQAELAIRVNLNRGNIASYESGTAEPGICKLLRMSKLFGITARDFTRSDLSNTTNLERARVRYNDKLASEAIVAKAAGTRVRELEDLVDSSHKLFAYQQGKHKKSCPEAELLAVQYQQLLDVTHQILKEHKSLLARVGCQCE